MPAPLTDVLTGLGITSPFPIQSATLADSLAGRDVLGRGRTGSGKTYAFALPIVARLAASDSARRPGRPRALILAPTRELASQIAAAVTPLASAMGLRVLTVFGGVGAGPQIAGLRAGVDILVACPGRLADHIGTGHANLDAVEITVLDEADHMADLGFLPIVGRLMSQTPRNGQRMLFSATLDGGISVLVKRFLTNPVTHSVDSVESPVSTMSHHVLHIREDDRLPVLVELAAAPGRTVVFTRTKQRAKRLTRDLVAAGVGAVELHGNLGQSARTRNLQAFSEGTARTLVATDIAARGIHVDDVALVVHADPPVEHKAYLHRSGRTARAGAEGVVITLMTDAQVGDVRELTRKAAITPTTTRLRPGDPMLAELAPGQRTYVAPPTKPAVEARSAPREGQRRNRPSNGRRAASGRSTEGRGAPSRTPISHPTSSHTSTSHASTSRTAGGRTATTRTANGAGETAALTAKIGGAAAFSATSRPRGGGGRGRG